ncbi:MAG TPA: antitoxin family protein [Pyrinomonadaceae bacterium]|nr:antitoxin family protein [Pyrinomonadaceae bacterium]
MPDVIEAVFDGTVFRPEKQVNLEPNTRVVITVTVKNNSENQKAFRVRSKRMGFRKDLDYDKTSELLEQIEGAQK